MPASLITFYWPILLYKPRGERLELKYKYSPALFWYLSKKIKPPCPLSNLNKNITCLQPVEYTKD